MPHPDWEFVRGHGVAAMLLAATGCTTAPIDRTTPERPPRAIVTPPVGTAGNPSVDGVTMPTDRTIAVNLRTVPSLSLLARMTDAAGFSPLLAVPGTMTLFAPTDAAWARLAPGTIDELLKPDNRATLVRLIRLHLVPARLTSTDLIARVRAGGGKATLPTLAGEPLTVTMTGSIVALADAGGDRSYIETADVRQANGIVHVVNGVLVPRL